MNNFWHIRTLVTVTYIFSSKVFLIENFYDVFHCFKYEYNVRPLKLKHETQQKTTFNRLTTQTYIDNAWTNISAATWFTSHDVRRHLKSSSSSFAS